MVGFMKGLGCGCCDVCGLDESGNAPGSSRIFLPSSLLPYTEPFNNSGPSHPSFGVVPVEGGMTWAECTVGDKLNPLIGSNTGPVYFGSGAEIEPIRYRAIVNTHVYVQAKCTRLETSAAVLRYRLPDNFFYTGFQLIVEGLATGTTYSTMARLVTQVRRGVGLNEPWLNGYGPVFIYCPEWQGGFSSDPNSTSSISRIPAIRFLETGSSCEIRFTYNNVNATIVKPSGTLSSKCSIRISLTAYGFARFSFYPPAPIATYIDDWAIDADI